MKATAEEGGSSEKIKSRENEISVRVDGSTKSFHWKPRHFRYVFWCLFYLVSATLFAYHVATLTKQFIDGPTNMVMSPKGIPFIPPDIYLCNRNPLSMSEIENEKRKNSHLYQKLKRVLDLVETVEYKDVNYFWETADSIDVFNAFGHKLNDQVIYSSFSVGDIRLKKSLNLSIFPHWHHQQCIKLELDPDAFENTENYATMFLFTDSVSLDNPNVTIFGKPLGFITYESAEFNFKPRNGFQVYVVPPGEYPHKTSVNFGLSAYMETDIGLQMQSIELIHKKNSPCSSSYTMVEYVNPHNNYQNGTLKFKATRMDCLYRLHHDANMEKCNCTTNAFPITVDRWKRGVKFCLDLNVYNKTQLADYMETIGCLSDVKKNMKQMYEQCRSSTLCRRIYYSYELSSYLMPMIQIKDQVGYRNRSNVRPGLQKVLSNLDRIESITALELNELMENFAKVIIHSSERFSESIKEELTYNLRNLFSDVGGILDFYLKVGLISLCELGIYFLERKYPDE